MRSFVTLRLTWFSARGRLGHARAMQSEWLQYAGGGGGGWGVRGTVTGGGGGGGTKSK